MSVQCSECFSSEYWLLTKAPGLELCFRTDLYDHPN